MGGNILVLGANGRFGRNISMAFARAGWTVTPFNRARDSLESAAQGADVIAMGWNLPYHRWAAEMPDLHAQVRAVALRHDATVLLPGNVYVFGEGSAPVLKESTSHRSCHPLGKLRIDMETAYRDAGVRTILLRAGDFLDTEASGNWFDRMIASRVWKGRIAYPGPFDRAHAWAFLPDYARAFVQLAEQRHSLPPFSDIPFPGYTLTGQDLATALSKATGNPVQVKPFAWWPFRLLRPVMPLLNGVFEMRYLWSMPHQLDDTRFTELLPQFAPTDLTKALQAAIKPLK